MKDTTLFTAALQIKSPWFIEEVEFSEGGLSGELHITIGHKKRTQFQYEDELCSVYDHQERTWRHLNFFQHVCYLHARVPRVKTSLGDVRLVEVPWAESGSSFTLLFEQLTMLLVKSGMSASAAGDLLGIRGKRVSNIIKRNVYYAMATQSLDQVESLSIDETSSRKGHNYLTILTDRKRKKVVGVGFGKDQDAAEQALMEMEIRDSDADKVKDITMDMSKAYIAAATDNMPDADIVFDRFHIAKLMNEAVDKVRREEQRQFKTLKNTRYLWLKNSSKLSEQKLQTVQALSEAYPNLGTAYRCKELPGQILDLAYDSSGLHYLEAWTKTAWQTGLEPVRKVVNTINEHWYGITTFFKHLSTNAFAERVNLKIQEIKRIAKGYRNPQNFKAMIYFHLGDLNLFNTH